MMQRACPPMLELQLPRMLARPEQKPHVQPAWQKCATWKRRLWTLSDMVLAAKRAQQLEERR